MILYLVLIWYLFIWFDYGTLTKNIFETPALKMNRRVNHKASFRESIPSLYSLQAKKAPVLLEENRASCALLQKTTVPGPLSGEKSHLKPVISIVSFTL